MHNKAVLFVDDEPTILSALKRFFLDEDYDTYFASGGREALEMLEHHDIQVVVSDMRMPGMSGLELLSIVSERHPHIIRLVLTGYVDTEVLLKAVNQGQIYRYVIKPWKYEEAFRTTIRQSLEYYQLRNEREMLLFFLEQCMKCDNLDETNYKLIRTLYRMHNRPVYRWSAPGRQTVPDF